MTGRVRRRLWAQFDLINHSVYLVTERSPVTAEAAFAQLAGQPQMGWHRTFRNPRLSPGMGVWRV